MLDYIWQNQTFRLCRTHWFVWWIDILGYLLVGMRLDVYVINKNYTVRYALMQVSFKDRNDTIITSALKNLFCCLLLHVFQQLFCILVLHTSWGWISVAEPMVYLLRLWRASWGSKWTDTTYHSVGKHERHKSLLCCGNDCITIDVAGLICGGWQYNKLNFTCYLSFYLSSVIKKKMNCNNVALILPNKCLISKCHSQNKVVMTIRY